MNLPLAGHRRLLGAYLKPQGPRVALLAGLLLAGIGLQLLNPQIIRRFIDTAQAAGPVRTLALAGLAYLAVGLASRGLALATFYTGQQVAWTATNRLRADLTGHALRLDMPFHKAHTPGELIERIDSDATALGEFFSQMTVKVAGNVLLAAAILALLYREDPRVGLALTAYTALTVAVLLALQGLGARRWAAARQAWADQSGFLEEHIAGAEDLRGVGAEAYARGKLDRLLRAVLERGRGGWMANALSGGITSFLYVLGYGLGLASGALLYTRGEVTIGTAFLLVYYIGMLAGPLDEIRHQAENLQAATASVGRINALFALRPQVLETPRTTLPPGPLEVVFEDVSFAYDDELADGGRPTADGGQRTADGGRPTADGGRPTADGGRPTADGGQRTADYESPHPQSAIPNPQSTLAHISFTLAPGRVLGVLGRTGSGKTTLTRLLLRLYDPQGGAIRLGGADLRDVALADLRGRVGMVTQDVQLFGASVRDNISLFDPAVSDDAIRGALADLGLLEWVTAMPGGLDARLEAGGGGISAGEAQLLATARLLLRDPGLVILDEAAARLDPVTEARLEQAIDGLLTPRPPLLTTGTAAVVRSGGEGTSASSPLSCAGSIGAGEGGRGVRQRTAIIIAHRLSTVQRADDILILEAGRVVEFGPRVQLAADPASRFSSLLRAGLAEALA